MVDPGLREEMVEYVVGHVLRYHLSTDQLWKNKKEARGEWNPFPQPLARQRRIGILGLGELGSSCADALLSLNFEVLGWSRTPKDKKRSPLLPRRRRAGRGLAQNGYPGFAAPRHPANTRHNQPRFAGQVQAWGLHRQRGTRECHRRRRPDRGVENRSRRGCYAGRL